MMVEAGFRMVFVGIETPAAEGLKECNKTQNERRNLLSSVKMMQHKGLDVAAGFIVGFDSDGADIFDRQVGFIQQSGITTAMVGILNAMPLTRLAKRLKSENRLLNGGNGNNVDLQLNFVPKMNKQLLVEGYCGILRYIY